MPEAYIVAAPHTVGGRRANRLAGWHPANLGGALLGSIVARARIDPAKLNVNGAIRKAPR